MMPSIPLPSAFQAQEARLQAARLLAKRGITAPPEYPDISTRQKARDVAQTFVGGQGVKLLPR